MTAAQTPEGLWRDYLFLTREMDKFLAADNIDMFLNLLRQREKLQAVLDKTDTVDFKKSPAGKDAFQAISRGNQAILQHLARIRNKGKKRQQLDNAYNIMTRPVGLRMDRKG